MPGQVMIAAENCRKPANREAAPLITLEHISGGLDAGHNEFPSLLASSSSYCPVLRFVAYRVSGTHRVRRTHADSHAPGASRNPELDQPYCPVHAGEPVVRPLFWPAEYVSRGQWAAAGCRYLDLRRG